MTSKISTWSKPFVCICVSLRTHTQTHTCALKQCTRNWELTIAFREGNWMVNRKRYLFFLYCIPLLCPMCALPIQTGKYKRTKAFLSTTCLLPQRTPTPIILTASSARNTIPSRAQHRAMSWRKSSWCFTPCPPPAEPPFYFQSAPAVTAPLTGYYIYLFTCLTWLDSKFLEGRDCELLKLESRSQHSA